MWIQILLFIVVSALSVGNVEAQQLTRATEFINPPFPDVVMCKKRVEPVVIEGKNVSQRAIYESIDPDRSSQYLCGWINLQYVVGARKAAKSRYTGPWIEWFRVQGYEAWREHPRCSTPPCGEQMEIFLTDDHVVTLSGDCSYNAVLNSAQSAKLGLITAYIEKLKDLTVP